MQPTDEHAAHWREHGYVVIPEVVDPAALRAAVADAHAVFPPWEVYAAGGEEQERLRSPFLHHDFPWPGFALNLLGCHPAIVGFVERLFGRDDLFLTQYMLWAKYAGGGDYEQPFHADHLNNTLLWPRPEPEWQQVPVIVYLSDVDETLGPTRVVSKQHDDLSRGPGARTREEHPDLYEHEVAVTVPAGSVLVHTMRTLHRGSAMTADQGMRLTLHLVFRVAGREFMGWQAYPRRAVEPGMEQFMAAATPRQRALIGVPLPGDPYWDEETITQVARRWPGFDPEPYRCALVP